MNDTNGSSQFLFMPGSHNQYSGEVRAHVLRAHMKQRKESASRRHKQNPRPQTSTCEKKTFGRAVITTPCSVHGVMDNCNTNVFPGYPPNSEEPFEERTNHLGVSALPVDQLTLEAPDALNGRFSKLERFHLYNMIEALYAGSHQSKSIAPVFHPFRDKFYPLLCTDTLGLLTACLYASESHTSFRDPQSKDSNYILSRMFPLLRKRCVPTATQADDICLAAVLCLISSDVIVRSRDRSTTKQKRMALHISGLQSMIRQRGGWASLSDSRIGWHIHWVDILSAGKISFSMTLMDHVPTDNQIQPSGLEEYAVEFCTLCSRLAYSRIPLGPQLLHCPQISSLMVAPLKLNYQPFQSKLKRFAIFLYLLIVSVEFSGSSESLQYVQYVQRKLSAQKVSESSSLESLVQVLITDFDTFELECPPRIWKTTRALYVLEKLSCDVQDEMERFFFYCLEGNAERRYWNSESVATPDSGTARLCGKFILEDAVWKDLAKHLQR